MAEIEEDWVTFARIVGLAVIGIVTVVGASAAWPQGIQPLQPLGGYSITPDGGITSFQDGSGYTVTPDGNGSWGPSGGYFISPDGGVSSWSGPVAPVILPDGGVVLAPIELDPQ